MLLVQIVFKVILEVVHIFLVLDFNHSLSVILVDGLDFKLTVRTKDELLIVPEIRVEYGIVLVRGINIQLQLNPVRRDILLLRFFLVLGLIKDEVILVKDR
jgi:hypothetical protein